jgi:hypothetical protein
MAAIFLTAASGTIFADQAEVLTQKQVTDAMNTLKPVREAKQKIMRYCDPCGKGAADNGKNEMLNTLNFKDMGKGQWSLLVNGKAVDLAYIYIPNPDKNGKKWKNLARQIGISVEGVDTYK